MALPQLNVYRHDRNNRALITLAGEIDLESVPLLRETLERCLRDGIRTIDVDLTPVTFCDCTGLNAFIEASQQTVEAGGCLQLHYPSPLLARMVSLSRSGFLLQGRPPAQRSPALPAALPVATSAPLPTARFEPQSLAPVAPTASGGVR
ncbi:STAS domain-containing protein [Streptomyces monticola]|uniref:STAS domain-containing protein n=1 Tax=Streptomyces monticola TaxID=2666263 RepID=A0ABW2JTI4_9ACTN